MTTATRKRAKAPEVDLEQKEFAGMESQKVPAISRAARAYKRAQRERMEAGEVEVDRKTKLIELMKQHELTDYHDRDIEISLDTKETIKVKTAVDEQDKSEESEEE